MISRFIYTRQGISQSALRRFKLAWSRNTSGFKDQNVESSLKRLAFDFLRGNSPELFVDHELAAKSATVVKPIPLQFEDCHYVCWLMRRRVLGPIKAKGKNSHAQSEIFAVIQDKANPEVPSSSPSSPGKYASTTFIVRNDPDAPLQQGHHSTSDDDEQVSAFIVIHRTDDVEDYGAHEPTKSSLQQRKDAKEHSMKTLYDFSTLLQKSYESGKTSIEPNTVMEALAKRNYLFLTFHWQCETTKVFPKEQAVFISKEDTKQLLRDASLEYLIDYFR